MLPLVRTLRSLPSDVPRSSATRWRVALRQPCHIRPGQLSLITHLRCCLAPLEVTAQFDFVTTPFRKDGSKRRTSMGANRNIRTSIAFVALSWYPNPQNTQEQASIAVDSHLVSERPLGRTCKNRCVCAESNRQRLNDFML